MRNQHENARLQQCPIAMGGRYGAGLDLIAGTGAKELSQSFQSTDRERENTMLENTNPFDDEIEKQAISGDTAEFSGRSRWDDFFLTLKLVGIALAILGAIWGIEFLQKD
jgi:hypothetical protein